MSSMDHLLIISHLLKNFNSIKGERAIQKLVYLVQSHTDILGYSFKWNRFGPVSDDLDDDLVEAEALGLINISWHDHIPVYSSPDKTGISEYWAQKSREFFLSSKTTRIIQQLKNSLGDTVDPKSLEVIASVDYLRKHNDFNLQTYCSNVEDNKLIFADDVLLLLLSS